jgi:hypothetical protein
MDTDNKYRVITELIEDKDVRNVFYTKKTPAEIWQKLTTDDIKSISELSKAMKKLVCSKCPSWIINGFAKLLYRVVYQKNGIFIDESDFFADQSACVSRALMAFLQRQYTLAHASCSATCMWDEQKKEMLCVRSLDWDGADDLAKCTRIFKFFDDESSEPTFQAAGVAGMVGILTGMKEGFSICINYAPWQFGAMFKLDPLFAIRKLLQDETIQTYSEAKQNVEQWAIGAPCFITICGQEKGEACVVECGKHKNYTRQIGENNFIVQTNHFDTKESPFRHHNKKFYKKSPPGKDRGWYYSDLLKNSGERRKLIESHLQTISINTDRLEEDILKTYLVPPVLNYETAQWVVMRPKSKSFKVFKSTSKLNCLPKR